MVYGYWGSPKEKEKEPRDFAEKAYRRKDLAAWDAKWHGLSPRARLAFLDDVKGPVKAQGAYRTTTDQPHVAAEKFPPDVLKELAGAGFVEVKAPGPKAPPDRVFAVEGAYDFAIRVRALRRMHLLAEGSPGEFEKYVNYAFYNGQVIGVLANVLRKAGIDDYAGTEEMIRRYVAHHRWPGWVVRSLDDPLAGRAIDAVREAGGPIPMADLLDRVEGDAATVVRASVEKLVVRLALVEDLDPTTWDLVVGLLPTVREELGRLGKPRPRPPLVPVASPREVGPEGGLVVDDLRAFLLEVAAEPPRLRQDGELFAKELGRFLESLGPVPPRLAEALGWTPEARLDQAFGWAEGLKLVEEEPDDKRSRLRLAPKGNAWLAAGLADQHARIFEALRALPSRNELLYHDDSPFGDHGTGDHRFLGSDVVSVKAGKGRRSSYYDLWDVKPDDLRALREAVDRALSAVPAGAFYRLESVAEHLAFGDANPVLLGLSQERVVVYRAGRAVPALEELREEAGRALIVALVRRRLIPVGAVRAAIDGAGGIAVARTPLLDAYFGRKPAGADPGDGATGESRVVVQPDFSVIVIGPSPAPAAELAPFCERTSRGGGPGATVLKLTRESVVRAVAHGMKPAEILARLRRLASNEVPANVLKEVQGWGGWVRRVESSTLHVLRCPDRETADRVASALRSRAERLTDTLLAVDPKALAAADRNKLRDHGILVQKSAEPLPAASRTTRRRS